MKYPLAYNSWGFNEFFAALSVLTSGKYTMGPKVARFEAEFAAKLGCKHAIMVNSGSSANLVGLAALKYWANFKSGEIIVPAVSWATTYYPITQLGFTPVFVDVEESTFNIDPILVEKAITKKTVAVMAVNLLGMPANLKKLRELCERKNIFLIEDNCESLGAKINDQYTGTFGVFGTHSFFFSHHMQTMEGGMITTNDDEFADYCRSLRAHGWVRDLKTNTLHAKGLFQTGWKDKFRFVLPGYNVRPLEISGAVGSEQLKKLDRMITQRRANAQVFRHEFEGWKDYLIQYEHLGHRSSWFGFAVLCGTETERDHLVHLLKRAGVETRPIVAGNFLNQPVMEHLPHRKYGTFPVAERIDKCGLFFGNDSRKLESKIKRVFNLIARDVPQDNVPVASKNGGFEPIAITAPSQYDTGTTFEYGGIYNPPLEANPQSGADYIRSL